MATPDTENIENLTEVVRKTTRLAVLALDNPWTADENNSDFLLRDQRGEPDG